MEQQVSLREVNQHLSQYIQVVEQGNEVLITRRGRPIAKLIPVVPAARKMTKKQQAAWDRILKFIEPGFDLGIKKFKREDLYDRR